MKTSNWIITVIGFLGIVLAAGIWAQSATNVSTEARSQLWEHLAFEHEGKSVTHEPELSRTIVRLGNEGWQLVDVESVVGADAATKFVFFFKRPK